MPTKLKNINLVNPADINMIFLLKFLIQSQNPVVDTRHQNSRQNSKISYTASAISQQVMNSMATNLNREKELKDFDESQAGVKGLVDSGVETVPRIFIRPADKLSTVLADDHFHVPVIDLSGISSGKNRREEIIKEILSASENWGFFLVKNHGVPQDLLDRMIEGIRLFNEQDLEAKKEFYSREPMRMVRYNSNYDLYKSGAANWRDTLTVITQFNGHLDPKELPTICRDVVLEYTSETIKLADTLLDLFSEGLGIKGKEEQLGECTKGWTGVFHYYPACPQPHLTIGATEHSDPDFLTILLQDQIGGLQVLHQNKWLNAHPVPGTLVVNIGDILQMISNERLKSVEHRVVAKRIGPRISAAMFFTGLASSAKVYGPAKELVSAAHPALYKEFTLGEFFSSFLTPSFGEPSYKHFKIPQ